MTTPHPPKKAAEGPFKVDREGFLLVNGLAIHQYAMDFEDVRLIPQMIGTHLADWLKTPSGKRWMEDNGVGGKR